jgi:hypothetical protein
MAFWHDERGADARSALVADVSIGTETSADVFTLESLGESFSICCADLSLSRILRQNFEAMVSTRKRTETHLRYSVARDVTSGYFSLSLDDSTPARQVESISELLYLIEKELTIELQKRRQDLLFLHAAALEWQRRAFLLAADSGTGKSTTAWGLLHHGFRYLTDELSPIDVGRMRIFAYPHALCLKQRPPIYRLPSETIDLGHTFHVPTSALPASVKLEPCPIGAVFLLHRDKAVSAPTLRELTPAEAGARLYLTVLNALAHDNRGLDSVAEIAERAPCFLLETADLDKTCALIRTFAEEVVEPDPGLP